MRKHILFFCLATVLCIFSSVLAQGLPCLDVSPFYSGWGSDEASRMRPWQQELIEEEFPLNEAQAVEVLQKEYPDATEKEVREWLTDGTAACVSIKGEKRWFEGVTHNFGYRNPEFLQKILAKKDIGSPFYDQVEQFVFRSAKAGYQAKDWQPYVAPMDYMLDLTLDIPRDKLPAKGGVGVWLPLPIETASQQDVRIISITPEKYLKARPRKDADIGYAHFEIPLDGRKDDLKIKARVLFRSYRQRFVVKADDVLPYDKERAAYQEWIRSTDNITVTPEIAATAREAAKGETNPYLAARNIYNYILENIRYSLVPHATVNLLGIPESVWVHERRHGDCGAQSMYFAAMCRSLGIPARASGGYQLFPKFAGTHFWAEFYLEGYGWVPVDPTVADAVDWTAAVTEEQRTQFKEYYFGNLDPYRLVIQRNVDIDPVPAPRDDYMSGERPLFVLQYPWLDCPACESAPLDLVGDGFSWEFTPVTP